MQLYCKSGSWVLLYGEECLPSDIFELDISPWEIWFALYSDLFLPQPSLRQGNFFTSNKCTRKKQLVSIFLGSSERKHIMGEKNVHFFNLPDKIFLLERDCLAWFCFKNSQAMKALVSQASWILVMHLFLVASRSDKFLAVMDYRFHI